MDDNKRIARRERQPDILSTANPSLLRRRTLLVSLMGLVSLAVMPFSPAVAATLKYGRGYKGGYR